MAVETATYISQLDPTKPGINDPKSEGDDHLRLTKSVLQNQFPSLGAAAVTVTAAELNSVPGKAAKAGDTYSGTHDMTGATVRVATQAATDASTKAASTEMVQNAILASSGITATLPGQGGNAGKVLTTNGVSASWGDQYLNGKNGTTATDNVTLTASSPGALSINPTGYGKYVTLPDATTCTLGAVLFTVGNKSTYPVGLKDSTGTILGWVPPFSSTLIGLADKTTAAGVWNLYGADPAAVTAQSGAVTYSALVETVALDANRTLLLMGGGNGHGLYAIIHDASTGQFGAQTTVRAGSVYWATACLAGTDKVLVCSCDNGALFETALLTISGTGFALPSVVETTLSASIVASSGTGGGGLVPVGSSFVVAYSLTGSPVTTNLRAITVSGTSVTVGGQTPVSGSTYALGIVAANSTTGLVFSATGTNHKATPITVSGTTISFGTDATWANNSYAVAIRPMGSRFLCIGNSSSSVNALVSVSGTTASASTFSATAISSVNDGYFFDAQISPTKWFLGYGTTTVTIGILTDTNGTASFATASTTLSNVRGDWTNVIKASASKVTLLQSDVMSTDTNSQHGPLRKVIDVDVSGATPAVTSAVSTELQLALADSNVVTTRSVAATVTNSRGSIPLYFGANYRATADALLSGAPGVFGVYTSRGISINGVSSVVCGSTGRVIAGIPSLTLTSQRDLQDGTLGNSQRSLTYIGSDRRIYGVARNANRSSPTVFAVECAA